MKRRTFPRWWALVLGLTLALSSSGAPRETVGAMRAAGLTGTPGRSTRQATTHWETLAQTPSSAGRDGQPGRVSRQGGRWVRTGVRAGVPDGALAPVSGDVASDGAGELEALFAAAGGEPPSPAPGLSFGGALDDGTRFNPDTQGAVGPNHVMVTLSSQVRIQDRAGGAIASMTPNQFWSGLGAATVFDPRVLYDRDNQRWIHTAIANPGETNAGLLLAVSQTANPAGTWHRHFIGVGATNRIFPDSPNVGFTKDWITVQANMFDNTNYDFFSSDIWVFNKTNLYNGAAASHRHFRYRTDGLGPLNALVPAVTYDNTVSTNFLVANWVGDYVDPVAGAVGLLRLFSIGGPIDAPVFSDFGPSGIFVYGSPGIYNPPWADLDPLDQNFAPQLGTTNRIYIGDSRIKNVVYRNSTIWCAHHVFLPYNNPGRCAVQWFAMTPGGTVLQRGRVDDATGTKFFAYPSIAVNQSEDVLLGYTRFGADQYPSANYAFHGFEDFPGTLRADTVLKAGEGVFDANDRGITPWGDWSATVVDPNDIDLWTLQEYSAAPSGTSARWGTWWGLVSPATSLALTMSASTNTVLATATISYSLRVTNLLNSMATGVRLTNTLPTGASFVSSSASQGSCLFAGGIVTCDLGAIAGRGAATAIITARLNESGTATNRAGVSAFGPDDAPGDNLATVTTTVVPSADLSLLMQDSPDPVSLNTTLTYLTTVSNAGPSVATSVFLTNTLPPGVTFVSATPGQGTCSRNGSIVTCTLGTIGPGTTIPVTIRVTPTSSAVLTNSAVVTSSAADLQPANNSANAITRANAAPTLTTIANRTIPEDGSTGPIAITVSDQETPAASLVLGGFSTAPALVPPGAITFGGSGSSRTVTVTPAPNGNGLATNFIYVVDADGSSTTNSFVLTVSPVNDPPTVSDVLNQTINEDTPLGPLNFTVGDVETPAASLQVTATSSNPTLVPGANIALGGSGVTRTLTITPATNQFGSATITVLVSDGITNATDTFVLTVNSVNDLPTISPLGDRTVDEDTGTGAMAFTVGDVETPVASLTLRALSSNPSLVSTSLVTFGGSGANRTVSVTPNPDQFGTAVITVIVTDANGGSTNRSFQLSVNNVNDPPTLASLSSIAVNEDSGTNVITLTVISAGPTNENQTVTITAASDNPSVVPNPSVDYTAPATTGTLRFTPSLNATGAVLITVTANDGALSNNITRRTFTITVLPVNDPPTISALTNQVMAEDTLSAPIPFTIGDVDSPVDSLTVSALSTNSTLMPPNGLILSGTGPNRFLQLRPATNQFGRTLISILVGDGSATATNSFLVDVTPVNDPPFIAPIATVTTPEDTATNVVIQVADDETSPAGLQVAAVSANPGVIPSANISVSGLTTNRTLTLTPALNASGSALITVTVTDGEGMSATNAFTLTVTPVNDPPTLDALGPRSVPEDSGMQVVTLTGIGSGAPNEIQSLTVTAVSSAPTIVPNPSVSYLSPNASGTLSFTPVPNANGTAQITVTVDDGQGVNNRFSRSFNVEVQPVNDPPTLSAPLSVTLAEDGVTNVTLTLADIDTPPGSLTVQAGSSNEELIDGSGLLVTGTGLSRTLAIAPLANQFGSATLTLQVSDGVGGTAMASIDLTVTPINDVPLISPIAGITNRVDTPVPPIAFTVADEETFADNLVVTARSTDSTLVPPSGLILGGSGFTRSLQIIPAAGRIGTATITVEVIDDAPATNRTSFTFRVRGPNQPPVISVIPSQATDKNQPTASVPFTVLDDDTPAGSLVVTASSSNPGLVANSAIVLGGSGGNRTVSVTPTLDQVGISIVTILVRDEEGATGSRSFQVTVYPRDYPPGISAITALSLAEDSSTNVSFTISDAETAPASLIVTAASSNPTVVPAAGLVLGGSGAQRSLLIQPAANQSGSSAITVSVTDGFGNTTNATFVVTVAALNDAPTLVGPSTLVIDEDTTSGPVQLIVADRETADTALTVTVQSLNQTLLPDSGLALAGGGANRTLVITPAPNQSGTATVVVTASDGAGGSVSSNLVVTVNPVNDSPTLNQPGNLTINEDAGPQVVGLTGISAGLGENQGLTITAESSQPSIIPHPAVSYTSPATNASLQFTPVANASGVVTITVTVRDGQAVNHSVSRSFTVTVSPANDPPTISAIAAQQTNEDSPLTVNFSVADAETPLGSLTLTATSTNASLVAATNVVFSGSGTSRTATIFPTADQSGTTLITLQVGDGALTATSSFVLTVLAVNDPPTLNPIANFATNAAGANPSHVVSLSGISAGAANESQTLSVTATSSNPTLLPNPTVTYTSPNTTGTLALRPGNNNTGTAVITVTVSDTGGGSNSLVRTFLVNIKASANVPPTLSIISNQTIPEDGSTGPIAFTMRDAETAAGSLTLYASSSNPSLVPTNNILFNAPGTNRTLTITPVANASGSAAISLTVVDGAFGASNMTFTVTVNPVNDAPTLAVPGPQTAPEDTVIGPLAVTLGDLESRAADLTLTAVSSDTNLVPNANIRLGGLGADRSISISPATNQSGTATLQLVASDGAASTTNSFTVTFAASNDVPTITFIPDQTVTEDSALVGIPFTIADVETPAGSLILSASSSNPGLFPAGTITFGGTGNARTVSLAPATNQSGSATIAVSVSDGVSVATNLFAVTVTPVNDRPTLGPIANLSLLGSGAAAAVPLAGITSGASDEAQPLQVTAISSDPAVVPHPAVLYASPSATGTLTVAAAPGASGSTVITVTVNDGQAVNGTAVQTFTVTVNQPPTITGFVDQVLMEDAPATAVLVSVADAETPANQLNVSVAAESPDLFGPGGLALTGTGGSRQVVLTPALNQYGQTWITVTVEDGAGQRTTGRFLTTIRPINDLPTLNAPGDLNLPFGAGAQIVSLSGISSGASNEVQRLTVRATSSNPDVVPHPVVGYVSPAGTGTLTLTPTGQGGTVTISVVVEDDGFDDGTGLNRTTRTFVVQIAAPALGIAMANGNVVTSWPTNGGPRYVLQASPALGSGAWSAAGAVPVVVNGRYTVTNAPTGPARFYRLCDGCGN